MSFLQSSSTFHELRKAKTCSDLRAAGRRGTDRPSSRDGILSPLVRLLRDPVGIASNAVEAYRDGLSAEERIQKTSRERQKQILEARLRNVCSLRP